MTTLYIKGATGALLYWSVEECDSGLEIEYGQVGGSPQYQYETIIEGKGGRDLDEQIESRMNSRINKQKDKGYVEDIEVAKTSNPTNALGFKKPMLAKKECDVDIQLLRCHKIWIQRKLDGNRCLIHNDGEQLIAYTRNGKKYDTLAHILEPLASAIPPGYTLDGELYVHGVPLQTIVSYAKRLQPGTLDIQYHVYDIISEDEFEVRLAERDEILDMVSSRHIVAVETEMVEPEDSFNLQERFEEFRAEGYEGLMVRSNIVYTRGKPSMVGYQDGKRSASLIKVKGWESEEFDVIDITESKDGWAILHFRSGDATFSASCPGSMAFKRQVWLNREGYLGKPVTLDFAYYTKDGVPFHPTAVAFRDYE